MAEEEKIYKGLAGVVVDTSEISDVDPVSNSLLYRGYPAEQLAASRSAEDVAYLLWYGELPTELQLQSHVDRGRSLRQLPWPVAGAVGALPVSAHPMDVIRTAVSALGGWDETLSDESPQTNRNRAQHIFAMLPTVIAADQRRRRGLAPIPPDLTLGFVENFLYMTFGEIPDPVVVRAFEASMVMYAEHSLNASTFAARVIASTLSDIYSSTTGAIGALKGRLHGGANEAVMGVFEEIGTPDNVEAWVKDAREHKRIVMGFGHRVYKNGDSRVPTMKAHLDALIEYYDRPEVGALYTRLEEAMMDATGLKPNVDYVTGPLFGLMGFDTEMFTPLFAAARVTGWTAHYIEQLGANSLIRPLAKYVGPARRDVPGYRQG